MSELIESESSYGKDGLEGIDETEHNRIRSLLLGHSVKKIADDHFQLDDGTVVKIVPNQGCGGCTAGYYELSDLNDCPNVITDVRLVHEVGDGEWDDEHVYRVFVVAEDRRISLFSVEGGDGNGYYGTGYELLVRVPRRADDE